MSLMVFAFGAAVCLITVHRTVVVGVELLTGRLDPQPEPMPETSRPQSATARIDRARVLVRSEF
jgi:hypothetical protein